MDALLTSIGGLGLFLFGMSAMTSGLKKLAGEKMHQWLGRATRTPLSGSITGAAVTAIVQSSSATTVAAVGFVGAGLMTFSQAVGVLFGANIGTTITGWAVALIGFKLKLGAASLPLLFVGALLYLNKSRPRLRGSGKALSGFALIFLGIDLLQTGIGGAREWIDLSDWSAGDFGGRILLVAVGIVLTLVTQSSSATVAASLTALNTGVLDLPQAAAVIIGADVGTTATAAMATIGGNVASRRTGAAHVVYNVLTGLGAFFLLPLYLWIWYLANPGMLNHSPEVVAVAFHSSFNLVGVIVALPFAKPFARLIERLIPGRGEPLTEALDRRLLGDPIATAQVLESTLRTLASGLFRQVASLLNNEQADDTQSRISAILGGVDKARDFAVESGKLADEQDVPISSLMETLHLVDHLERLAERSSRSDWFVDVHGSDSMRELKRELTGLLTKLADELEGRTPLTCVDRIAQLASELEEDKPRIRSELIASATRGDVSSDQLDAQLDAHRHLRRIAHHSWRIAHYASVFPSPSAG